MISLAELREALTHLFLVLHFCNTLKQVLCAMNPFLRAAHHHGDDDNDDEEDDNET